MTVKEHTTNYEIDQWAAAPAWKLVVVGAGMVVAVVVIKIIKLFSSYGTKGT
jgi:hypothetical protein